jgi:glutamate 5-kinase
MRKKCLENAKRIVVKVGTAVVTTETGKLDHEQIHSIASQLDWFKQNRENAEVILVSSGAIAAGVEKLGLAERPTSIPELQAAASVGQGLLIQEYMKAFDALSGHFKVGQVLLTHYDVSQKEHQINAMNTFEKLLNYKVIPIVNENDTTVIEEIKIGDNDFLAAHVTKLLKADLLILLSDIDGFFTSDPRKDKGAELIPEVAKITDDIENYAGGAGTAFSSGGMATKINAAKEVTQAGSGMLLLNGRDRHVIHSVFADNETKGTFFAPADGGVCNV